MSDFPEVEWPEYKKTELHQTDFLSTGIPDLDKALGGGLPKGNVVEIFGGEAQCKSTLSLRMMAEVQKENGIPALIDAEHSFDPQYSELVGLDISKMLVSQPDCGEQALEIVHTLVVTNAVNLVVVDSAAALTPLAELTGEIGAENPGLYARMMSQAMRRLVIDLSKTKACVVFLNQVRSVGDRQFNNDKEKSAGSGALKYYSAVRVELSRRGPIKEGERVVGHSVRARVVKNKYFTPFTEAEFYLPVRRDERPT